MAKTIPTDVESAIDACIYLSVSFAKNSELSAKKCIICALSTTDNGFIQICCHTNTDQLDRNQLHNLQHTNHQLQQRRLHDTGQDKVMGLETVKVKVMGLEMDHSRSIEQSCHHRLREPFVGNQVIRNHTRFAKSCGGLQRHLPQCQCT